MTFRLTVAFTVLITLIRTSFAQFDQGSYLPLAVVKTNGYTIVKGYKITVDFGIIDNGPGNKNYLDDVWNGYSGKAGLEYRGSSSMMFPKKNYSLEIRTETGLDSAISLVGLPPEADWVLHGPYSDKSLIRNRLAYDIAREMGNYAPRARFCELFIDNRYEGLYVLIERIKRDNNRVDIAKLDSTDVEGTDLTGGYIVKIDRSADDSYTDGFYSNHTGSGDPGQKPFFAWHYPKRDVILPVQQNYIRNRINSFENAVFGVNYLDPVTGYRNYVDVNSFVDYFILVELSKNVDGYRLSTFLHKDRDDRNPLIRMGPVWDYDLAFGNADYFDAFNTSGWMYPIKADGWGTPRWWVRFMGDPYFTNKLNCRWKSLRENVLSDQALIAMVEAYIDTMGDAIDRNFKQWPIHGNYIWPNPYVGKNYSQDIGYMKDWILKRVKWIDRNILGSCLTPVMELSENTLFTISNLPNPSSGQVNLEIQNPLQLKLSLDVLDLSGSIVYSEKLLSGILINRSVPLPPGVYIVRTGDGKNYRTIKAVVQ